MSNLRPTLRRLAAGAGVSAMTVSLALRGSRDISAAMRKKITRLAAARGYRPDPQVVKLMHHLRMRAPALFRASIIGLARRAQQLGYAFETVSLGEFRAGANLQRVPQSRGVEGVMVMPFFQPTELV